MTGFWSRLLGRSPAGKPDTTQPVPAQAEALATASSMKAYELQRELGRGAMAVVHLAIERSSGQQVAIKRLALQREFSAEDLIDVRQRFMREARAAGQLQHPDILQMLDAGQDGEDAWIAMAYAPGQDLSHYTRTGSLLPVSEVLRVGMRLAKALDYAHAHGVVHRDIKPANVMLDLNSGSLKIMDFGIARIADGSRTRTGLVLGTPSFMSPEQLAGLSVDGRSDLYSLGAMLYQLLTGQLPHQSDSMAKLMYQIANQRPADVRSHRPELPEALALILALALEKRPELRYPSGEQMALDLAAVLARWTEDEPVASNLAAPADTSSGTVDSFAQTVRLDAPEAGQNPPASQPSTKP
jgi:serine/threonine protein kinase